MGWTAPVRPLGSRDFLSLLDPGAPLWPAHIHRICGARRCTKGSTSRLSTAETAQTLTMTCGRRDALLVSGPGLAGEPSSAGLPSLGQKALRPSLLFLLLAPPQAGEKRGRPLPARPSTISQGASLFLLEGAWKALCHLLFVSDLARMWHTPTPTFPPPSRPSCTCAPHSVRSYIPLFHSQDGSVM